MRTARGAAFYRLDAPAKDHLRRNAACDGVLIYCADYRCGNRIEMMADRWSDELRMSDIELCFVFTRCGQRGAEVRPKFPEPHMACLLMLWSACFFDPIILPDPQCYVACTAPFARRN
ncbi:hypothetical protein [Bradyrhizobium genosp. A]|uniref:hypothetical protein n=1 Tax=Bradyrhizobium genosp. A TaxID=83626 RepID=UPI003CF71801